MRQFSRAAAALFAGAVVVAVAVAAAGRPAMAATRPADDPPSFSVAVAGVGLPSTISLGSDAAGVTSFDYEIAGGRPAVVAARNGTGAGTIVFPAAGAIDVTAHAYAGRRLIGETTQSVDVSDAPGVTSDQFLDPEVTPLAGSAGTFTFTPHARGVVKYNWWLNEGDALTVRARPDGSAKVSWTPPTAGKYELFVQSVTAGGTVSTWFDDLIAVRDPRPTITPAAGTHGLGDPVSVTLSNSATQATGFVYRFDGGPQQSVTGTVATVRVTPTRAGALVFTARTVLAGGGLSDPATATITVTDAPRVTVSGPYGEKQPVGTLPTTFTFTPAVPNVVSYRYTVDGDSRTVAAGPDGTASVTFTPDPGGPHSLTVSSVDIAGVVSDAEDYEYTALDPTIWAYPEFDGGAGQQGLFSVVDDLTPVIVAFHWSVDGAPEQVTTTGGDGGTFTELDYTPAQSGSHTLRIEAEYEDGTRSPVATSTFDVN